jgi:hypothetical protein
VTAAACGGGGGSPDAGPSVTHRGGADACPLAGGCDGLDFSLAATVLPPVSFTGAAQGFGGFSKGSLSIELKLKQTVNLCGEVRLDVPNLTGTIFARPASPDPGVDLLWQAPIVPPRRFCIRLPLGEHVLKCVPDDPGSPPFAKKLVVESGTKSTDFAYPSGDAAIKISGRVVLDPSMPVGIDGIQVKAYDPATGIESNTAVTGESVPDGKGGAFSLYIPSGTGTYTVSVWPTSANPDWPRMEFPGIITGGSPDLLLSFGPMPRIFPVNGRVEGTGNAPASLVEFRSTIGGGPLYKAAKAASDGTFFTNLREGLYEVTLVPGLPGGMAGMSHAAGVAVPPEGGELVLSPGLKRRISGAVKFPDGEAGAGVLVSASRIGGCGLVPAPGGEKFEMAADSAGQYSMAVDEGIYTVTFTPPQGVYNAGMTARSVCIDGDTALSVTLPRTVLRQGMLLDQDDNPLPGATINFVLSPSDDPNTPLPAAKVVTDAEGKFMAALPDL